MEYNPLLPERSGIKLLDRGGIVTKVILPPLSHNLLFDCSFIISWRYERLRGYHTDDDDRLDAARRIRKLALGEERDEFLEDSSLLMYDREAFESVPLATERINDIDFNVLIRSEIGYCAGRANVGKDKMLIIQNAEGALR